MFPLKFILLSSSLVFPQSLPNIYGIESFGLRYTGERFREERLFAWEAITEHGRVLVCPAGRTTGEEREKCICQFSKQTKMQLTSFNSPFQSELKMFSHRNEKTKSEILFRVKTGSSSLLNKMSEFYVGQLPKSERGDFKERW